MSLKVTLHGVQEAVARIKKYQENLFDAVDVGTKEAAFFIEREAKLNAPVNTGRLRASIHPEIISINQSTGKAEMIVADYVDYGLFVEFKHPTKSGFFRRAADSARKEFPNIVIGKVEKIRTE